MKSCSVNLERVLRSQNPAKNKKTVSNVPEPKTSYVPAKRVRRCDSLPPKAAMRHRNSQDSEAIEGNGKNKGKNKGKPKGNNTETDGMMDIIGLNCKLTNDMLGMKKQLVEKLDEFNKMQKQFFEKDVECLKLKSLLSEKEKLIDDFKKEIDALKDQMFCSDLIQFDVEDQNGKRNLYHCAMKYLLILSMSPKTTVVCSNGKNGANESEDDGSIDLLNLTPDAHPMGTPATEVAETDQFSTEYAENDRSEGKELFQICQSSTVGI